MFVYPFSMLPVEKPVSLVKISSRGLPNSITIFGAVFPFSLKNFTVVPLERTVSFSNAINKLALIDTINVPLTAKGFQVILVITLEDWPFSYH